MKSEGNVYFLQYGIYTSKEVLEENIKKLENYALYEEDNKYYVYLGVFTSYENANKVKNIFENENIYTYIKNSYLQVEDLVKKIDILDKKMISSKKEGEIRELNKKMLDLYKKFLNQ